MSKRDWFPSLPSPAAWMEQAACAHHDPELFFQVGITPEQRANTRQAQRICQGCPVQAECLALALDHDERHGIWAGLTPCDRRKINRGAP